MAWGKAKAEHTSLRWLIFAVPFTQVKNAALSPGLLRPDGSPDLVGSWENRPLWGNVGPSAREGHVMKFESNEDIDEALRFQRQRLKDLERRIRENDPTLPPNAGYILHMARKSTGRTAELKTEREEGIHRYFAHQDRDGVQMILCSCGGAVPGDIRVMGEKAFLEAEGHIPYE